MQTFADNPIQPFLDHQGVLILDGGLATRLEWLGCKLEDELWSARILLEAPEKIRQVHCDFLEAGADCIITSSYQASVPGFQKLGLSKLEVVELFHRSVRLAEEARKSFWNREREQTSRRRPLIAASVGPYGAYLADGSEYTGCYDIEDEDLYLFHKERWQALAGSSADLLACETIPSRQEAAVLLRLLEETPSAWAWVSFACRDERHVGDGTRLREVAELVGSVARVAAIGINCTSPELIAPLMKEVSDVTEKPIVVYPNSGERYSLEKRCWFEVGPPADWAALSAEWIRLGAGLIGGCCRVGCSEIARIRKQALSATASK